MSSPTQVATTLTGASALSHAHRSYAHRSQPCTMPSQIGRPAPPRRHGRELYEDTIYVARHVKNCICNASPVVSLNCRGGEPQGWYSRARPSSSVQVSGQIRILSSFICMVSTGYVSSKALRVLYSHDTSSWSYANGWPQLVRKCM